MNRCVRVCVWVSVCACVCVCVLVCVCARVLTPLARNRLDPSSLSSSTLSRIESNGTKRPFAFAFAFRRTLPRRFLVPISTGPALLRQCVPLPGVFCDRLGGLARSLPLRSTHAGMVWISCVAGRLVRPVATAAAALVVAMQLVAHMKQARARAFGGLNGLACVSTGAEYRRVPQSTAEYP